MKDTENKKAPQVNESPLFRDMVAMMENTKQVYKNEQDNWDFPFVKTYTPCCALCMLSRLSNDTPIGEIRRFIKFQEDQMNANEDVGGHKYTGQTSIMCVVSPGERVLFDNLREIGFNQIAVFNRRKGYPDGVLRLMFLPLGGKRTGVSPTFRGL